MYWKRCGTSSDEESFTLVLANGSTSERSGPQERPERRGLDRRPVGARADSGQLRAAGPDPGTARPERTRKQLVREITRHTQRLQKTLEDANVKLTHVVTDILGVSGRAILAALIAGETDPERLADCTTGRLKADRADIIAAVHGRVTAHHRFLLELHLGQIDALRAAVQKLEQQADEVLRPFREAAERLTTIPGVSETVARVLVAEIGGT